MLERGFKSKKLDSSSFNELNDLSRLARGDILTMTTLAGCGHPGGSMSSIDMYSTLCYGPVSNAPNLIRMSDPTSILFLNGATLKNNLVLGFQSGPLTRNNLSAEMELTKGTLIVDHKSFIESTGTVIFGDGNPDNDLHIEFMPGGNLKVKTGKLDYKNVN